MKYQSLQRVKSAQIKNSKIQTGSNGLEYWGLPSQFCLKKKGLHICKRKIIKVLLAKTGH